MGAVVAPYLISCAIATGDPLFAINYHTVYYRFAEQRPIDTADERNGIPAQQGCGPPLADA